MKPEFVSIDGFDLPIPDSPLFKSDKYKLVFQWGSDPAFSVTVRSGMHSGHIATIGSVGETYWRDKADELFEEWRLSSSTEDGLPGFNEYVEKHRKLTKYFTTWRNWRRKDVE